MKLQDKETLNVADTVKDVLEGKKPVKEMDPKKHVSKKDDKFVVVNKDGDVVKSFDNEDEANKYAIDNHDDLMKEGPEEPRAKGEKEFKDKHTVKKTYGPGAVEEQVAFAFDTQKAARDFGNKVDGMPMNIVKVGSGKYYVVELRQDADKKAREKAAQIAVKIGLSESYEDSKEVTITLDEAKKAGKGNIKLDIDWIGDKKLGAEVKKKYKVTVKPRGRSTADVSGKKADVLKMLMDPTIMGMDSDDVEDIFPELFESKKKEEGNAFGKAVMAAKEKGEKTFVFAGKKYKVTGEEVEEELSAKQKKYRAFFDKALKKFGVKSPDELEGDKKKEFFDYVDANYEADNETD